MNNSSIAGSCKEGDPSTLLTNSTIEEIYNRNVSTIYRICYLLLHNVDDAEDAVQTIFMKLISVNPKLHSTEHEKAWLIVTAQNHCKNILKQRWKRKRVDIESIEEPISENDSWKKELLQEVFRLKDKYKIVIYLYYYEGYSTEEIGKMLHLNSATVRSRLHVARKNLKMNLEESNE